MNTFKEFYQSKPIFSVREIIIIDGIGETTAKIDSGNEAHNVIHGVDLKIEGNMVTFTTINNKRITKNKCCEGDIKINIGSGVTEDRPVVRLDFRLNGKQYSQIPFSIGDRTENDDPVLIGEPFLKKLNALIDVNKPIKNL